MTSTEKEIEMDLATIFHLECLLVSLNACLSNIKNGCPVQREYMLEKINEMKRVLQTESGNMDKLRNLIWHHEYAVRNYAYARGLYAGLNNTGHFLVDPDQAIIEYADTADEAEQELYDFIEGMEK